MYLSEIDFIYSNLQFASLTSGTVFGCAREFVAVSILTEFFGGSGISWVQAVNDASNANEMSCVFSL